MAKFRLAGLLKLRKLKEETASAELAKRTGARRQMEQREAEVRSRLGSQEIDAHGSRENWVASVVARGAMMANLEAARAAVAQAAEEEAVAQREYQRAKQEAVPLEKLEEKHRQAEFFEEMRKEQNILDELASQRAARDAAKAVAKGVLGEL